MIPPRNPSGVDVADDHSATTHDYGFPSGVIRFSTMYPTISSCFCASNPCASTRSPRIRLYRRKEPSTRACCR